MISPPVHTWTWNPTGNPGACAQMTINWATLARASIHFTDIFKMQEDYCLRYGRREKCYSPKSIGSHLRCLKMVDTTRAKIHIYITCIFMLLHKNYKEKAPPSELIQVVYVWEKLLCLSYLVFKLVKLFYSYSVYFYEAESKVIFLELRASVFKEHEY